MSAAPTRAEMVVSHSRACAPLSTLLARINTYLMRWTRKKYKRLRPRKKARAAWQRITSQFPRYFAHWAWVNTPLMIKMARAE